MELTAEQKRALAMVMGDPSLLGVIQVALGAQAQSKAADAAGIVRKAAQTPAATPRTGAAKTANTPRSTLDRLKALGSQSPNGKANSALVVQPVTKTASTPGSTLARLKQFGGQQPTGRSAARPIIKAAMSTYEAAVVACLEAQRQLDAAELALGQIQQNAMTAEIVRNNMKAQLLLEGNTDEVWRVNEKYDLGYADYAVEAAPRAFGFGGSDR